MNRDELKRIIKEQYIVHLFKEENNIPDEEPKPVSGSLDQPKPEPASKVTPQLQEPVPTKTQPVATPQPQPTPTPPPEPKKSVTPEPPEIIAKAPEPPIDKPQTDPNASNTPVNVQPANTVKSNVISRIDAVRKMGATKGRFFTVIFIKKTDGTERLMNCRLGVTRYLKGGTLRYNPAEKGLLPVFDMQKKAYRMVNINTLKILKIGHEVFQVGV